MVSGISVLIDRSFDIAGSPFISLLTENTTQSLLYYLIFTVVATVLVPVPTLPLDVVVLKIFNPWVIIGLRFLGGLIGTAIAYGLARRFGKPLIRRAFAKKNAEQIVIISESVGWKQYLVIALFPLVNTELVAYAAGLSRLKLWTTLWVVAAALSYRLLIVFVLF